MLLAVAIATATAIGWPLQQLSNGPATAQPLQRQQLTNGRIRRCNGNGSAVANNVFATGEIATDNPLQTKFEMTFF